MWSIRRSMVMILLHGLNFETILHCVHAASYIELHCQDPQRIHFFPSGWNWRHRKNVCCGLCSDLPWPPVFHHPHSPPTWITPRDHPRSQCSHSPRSRRKMACFQILTRLNLRTRCLPLTHLVQTPAHRIDHHFAVEAARVVRGCGWQAALAACLSKAYPQACLSRPGEVVPFLLRDLMRQREATRWAEARAWRRSGRRRSAQRGWLPTPLAWSHQAG